jgi:hypothetical protein
MRLDGFISQTIGSEGGGVIAYFETRLDRDIGEATAEHFEF